MTVTKVVIRHPATVLRVTREDVVRVDVAIVRVQLELTGVLLGVLSFVVHRVETGQHTFLVVLLPPPANHVELFGVFDLKQVEYGKNVRTEELMAKVVATVAAYVVKSGSCLRVDDRVLD